jgi:hypothetical protein
MRIDEAPQFPRPTTGVIDWIGQWLRAFSQHWLRVAQQLNGVSEGRISALHTAATAAPTAGGYLAGDIVRNAAPSEAGTGGGKHVVTGWICVVGGTPGTWVEMRTLTGN